MSALSITLLYSNILDLGLVGVTSSSLMDCVHTCYHDLDCASFFSGNGFCYPSSSYYKSLPMTNSTQAGMEYYGWEIGDACPTPFTYHRPTGQCLYGEWEVKRSHTSAVNYCNVLGGRLAVLDKPFKNILVASFGIANEATLWTGGSRTGSTWKWVTGDIIGPFTEWDSDPTGAPGACLIMSRISNNWRPYDCSGEFRFVCEKIITDENKPCGLLTEF